MVYGQKTPLPPRARPKGKETSAPLQISGPSPASHLLSTSYVGSAVPATYSKVDQDSEIVSSSAAPVPGIEIPDVPSQSVVPIPCCALHHYSTGLAEVISWLHRASTAGFRYVLALDQHKVSDRAPSQTREVLRTATREGTLVLVLSFISDRSYDSHGRSAVEF